MIFSKPRDKKRKVTLFAKEIFWANLNPVLPNQKRYFIVPLYILYKRDDTDITFLFFRSSV